MHPIPCSHCGGNFMRPTLDPEAPKLCNNCLLREEKRNPTKKENMEQTIDIKITCPIKIHNEIEEFCINNGITLSNYFLDLHRKETKSFGLSPVKDAFMEVEEVPAKKKVGKK